MITRSCGLTNCPGTCDMCDEVSKKGTCSSDVKYIFSTEVPGNNINWGEFVRVENDEVDTGKALRICADLTDAGIPNDLVLPIVTWLLTSCEDEGE
jgi:hypothetical protein